MSVSRRQLLGGVALIGAAGAVGVHRIAGSGAVGKAPRLVVYDSRRPASLAFARGHAGIRQIDLASAASWSAVRQAERKAPVAGLTGWNDYVSARQWLEDRGLRLASERRDPAHDLIAWTMA